jgi:ATP/maltotriose-dependent transcriptional regulator MalT
MKLVEPQTSQMVVPLTVAAKFAAPDVEESVVRLDQLNRVSAATHSRLLVVHAPAGSGKTTLIAQAATHFGWSAVWYRLDAFDRHPLNLLAAFVLALRRTYPTFCERLAEQFASHYRFGIPEDEAFALFVGGLGDQLDRDTYLILDDYESVASYKTVHSGVEYLIHNVPPLAHVIVLTRHEPPLALARLRLAGEVAELGPEDLRFDLAQTAAVLKSRSGREATTNETKRLIDLTEGWAAGVDLVARTLQWTDFSTMTDALVRRDIRRSLFDYLTEEVFDRLPVDVRTLVNRTCCLSSVTRGLAARLAPDVDADQCLEYLADNRTFTSVDIHRSSYRYHGLLREYVQNRVRREGGEQALRDLEAETATALREEGDVEAAVGMFLQAGDPAGAVDILLEGGAAAVSDCSTACLRSLKDMVDAQGSLPPSVALLVTMVLANREGRAREAASLAQENEAIISGCEDDLCRSVLLQEAQNAAVACGNHEEAVELAQSALEAARTPRQRGRSSFLQAFSLIQLARWEEAEQIIADVHSQFEMPPDLAAMIEGLGMNRALQMGDFRTGLVVGRRVQPAIERHCPAATRAGFSSVLAYTHSVLGDYGQARELMVRARDIGGQLGLDGDIARSADTEARLLAAEGAGAQAVDHLKAALSSAALSSDAETRAQLSGELGIQLVRLGRLDEAGRALREALDVAEDLRLPWIESLARCPLAYLEGLRSEGITRALSKLNDIRRDAESKKFGVAAAQAVFYALSLTYRSRSRGRDVTLARLSQVVAWQLQFGHVDFLSQELSADTALLADLLRVQQPTENLTGILDAVARNWRAERILTNAVRMEEQIALVTLDAAAAHLDEEGLERLLKHATRHASGQVKRRASEARSRVGLSTANEDTAFPELTPRELEILTLVAAGRRNGQIAADLSLSAATVKTHVHRILGKLGVDSRMQATLEHQRRTSAHA